MSSDDPQALISLSLVWLAYFVLHSWFASLGLKNWVAARHPHAMPIYRLLYNSLALILLIPPLWLMWHYQGPWLWRWDGTLQWVALGLSGLAMIGFVWSTKFYDMREFLGLRQLREGIRSVADQERFHLSALHRYVRHPWYFLGLILIWTRDMNAAMLLSALVMTAYFVIGSRLEERKLIEYHGEVYRAYRERVGGIVPLPWRYLTAQQARDLLRAHG